MKFFGFVILVAPLRSCFSAVSSSSAVFVKNATRASVSMLRTNCRSSSALSDGRGELQPDDLQSSCAIEVTRTAVAIGGGSCGKTFPEATGTWLLNCGGTVVLG